MLALIFISIFGGSLIGLLNGMLGMGGAFIVIPLLDELLTRQGMSVGLSHIMAIGTAPSIILFTCIASFFAHRTHGSVRRDILLRMGPYIFAGSMAGAFLAPHAPTIFLKFLFAVSILLMGLHLLFPHIQQKVQQEKLNLLEAAGFFFGMLASLSGLAGTLLCLTYLNLRGVSWCQAVGTSSGIGLIIAITSTAGFIFSGWNVPGLPAWSLGYVYVPGVACFVLPSMFMAKIGACLINRRRLPMEVIKKGLGLLNFFIAFRVVASLF